MELAPHTDSFYRPLAQQKEQPALKEGHSRLTEVAWDHILTIAATVAIFVAAILTFDLLASVYWWQRSMPVAMYVIPTVEWLLLAAILVQERRRSRLKALLSDSEVRIELAADAADLGLWCWDAKTDKFWATKHGQELLGLPAESSYDSDAIIRIVHPDDRALVDDAARQVLATNSSNEVEFRISLPDGQVRWLRGRGVGRSKDGASQVMGTIMDITERRKMQEEVQHHQQSVAHLARVGIVGELSAALAHELNQPLTAIMSNAQAAQRMLGKTPVDMEELSGAIADIIEDDMRAGDVIHHLRSLLKDNQSSLGLCDLNSLVHESLSLTRSDLISRHISVTRELCAQPLPVVGDDVQLQQVVLNLILNAGEAIAAQKERKGQLTVSTGVSGSFAHLKVSDNGTGIPPNILDKLFDPFFTTKQSGMGLGLAICQAIVTRHAGRIWATNNDDFGATFHVSLPLAQAGAS
jgi:PAS domain S-box-containing protein